jgi:hypothetical protein
MNNADKVTTVQGGYLLTSKLPGCKAKERVERILAIELPPSDIQLGRVSWDVAECNKKRPFPMRVGSTYSGRLFTIEYSLLVFMKHDSWNEFGEGNCISVPLKIN